MLLLGHSESVIRYAVMALGSLHHQFSKSRDKPSQQLEFAMRNYGKAMQQLIRLDTSSSTRAADLALSTSLLFACFEILNSNFHSALKHLYFGSKILEDSCSKIQNRGKRVVPLEVVGSMFMQAETQTLSLGRGTILLSPTLISQDLDKVPESFESADEALSSLEYYLNRLQHFFHDAKVVLLKPDASPESSRSISEHYDSLKLQFNDWNKAFDSLCRAKHPASQCVDGYDTVLTIIMTRNAIKVMLDAGVAPSELVFDKFEAEFEEIVDCAEQIVERAQLNNGPSCPVGKSPQMGKATEPIFSMRMSFVPPLYLCAAHCRERNIRRRALRLLKECNRREGMWDSNLCALLAERVVEVEERQALEYMRRSQPEAPAELDCASQVPEHTRLNVDEVEFRPQRDMRIKYTMAASKTDSDHCHQRQEFVENLTF